MGTRASSINDRSLAVGLIAGAILALALITILTWWTLGAQLTLRVNRVGLPATLKLIDGGQSWKGGLAVLSLDVTPRKVGRMIAHAGGSAAVGVLAVQVGGQDG